MPQPQQKLSLIALTEQKDDNEQHSSTGLPFISSAAEEMCNPGARTLYLDITYIFAVTDAELITDVTSLLLTVSGTAAASCIESGTGVVRMEGECQPLILTWPL